MKKSILLLTLLWLSTLLSAQTIEFIGVIKDSTSKEPISYATIIALNDQDSIVAGTISDERGRFKILISHPNNLVLKITFLGYHPFTISLTRTDKRRIDLGAILLNPDII